MGLRGWQITASPHIRSGACPVPTFRMHAVRKPLGMGPIYKNGCRVGQRVARSPSIPHCGPLGALWLSLKRSRLRYHAFRP